MRRVLIMKKAQPTDRTERPGLFVPQILWGEQPGTLYYYSPRPPDHCDPSIGLYALKGSA